ncbi:MAG: hypothetical protein KDM63_11025 [Verrucomicrobiae bacterium]|nr:hypothetical protein [Verrucomicrobiae bacterium]
MAKIEYTFFKCPEADCPMMGTDGLPCVIQIAEGERRRCPCERKIKLTDGHKVPPPNGGGVKSRRTLVIVGCGGLVLLLLAMWLFIPGPPPRIEIEGGTLDFGAAPAGAQRVLPLTIRNAGKGELSIISAQIVGDGFQLNDSVKFPFNIGGGKSGQIEVVFRPVEVSVAEGKLMLRSNDPDRAIAEVALSGALAISLDEAIQKAFKPLDDTSAILK